MARNSSDSGMEGPARILATVRSTSTSLYLNLMTGTKALESARSSDTSTFFAKLI